MQKALPVREGENIGIKALSDRVFYYPHEPERDRPMLACLRGSKFSLAIDAGYSADHVADFYAALEESKMDRPDFTVITHWHYDHTFGMSRIHGCSIACEETNRFLREQQRKAAAPGYWNGLKKEDHCFAKEYQFLGEPKIVLSDVEFQNRMVLNLGGLTAVAFRTESPHSDDTVCVYVPEEEILFLGDATSEDFFNGSYMDRSKLENLVSMIKKTACRYCVLSHAEPLEKKELLDYLYSVLKA